MTGSHRQNKSPFAIALGDWFPLRTYFLTSKASPNDTGIIVIIVVIIVSEAKSVWHSDGIIAQSFYLDRVSENHGCVHCQRADDHENQEFNATSWILLKMLKVRCKVGVR